MLLATRNTWGKHPAEILLGSPLSKEMVLDMTALEWWLREHPLL